MKIFVALACLFLLAASATAQTITPQIGGGISFGGVGDGGLTPPPVSGRLPCDIAARAGTPCVVADSVTRRMWSGYTGNLFQLIRASDSTTQNIGFIAGSGIVNQTAINNFCTGTTCSYSIIYDQMHTAASGNNLPQATAANQAPISYTTFSNSRLLPMVATGSFQFYRNRAATVGMPTGNASITEYDVINTFNYSPCCGTYGDMEATVTDNGSGHMFALGFAIGGPQAGTGNGPWPGIDYENGFYTYGAPPTAILLSTIGKYNSGNTTWTLKSDPGLSGSLTTLNNSTPPAMAAFEGGLSLGEGGDGTPAPTGFFEGLVIAGATSDATDNAIAANAKAFYSQFGTPVLPKQNFLINAGNNDSANPLTVNPEVHVPAHSLITVLTWDDGTSASDTITDTQGNPYTQIGCEAVPGVGGGNICIWYAANTSALSTSDTITLTVAGSPTSEEMQVQYAQNILTVSPLDTAVTASASGASGFPSVTSGTPTQLGELILAYEYNSNPQVMEAIGWNIIRDSASGLYNKGYLINTNGLPSTYTILTSNGAWAAMAVGFKLGSSVSSYVGPGDVVAGATVFYGLRAYTDAYALAAGKLVNLKRASDSHTCDILSDLNGNANATANCSSSGDNGQPVATWCNSTICSVLVAYDQTGNGNDANIVVGTSPTINFNCLNTTLPCFVNAFNVGLLTTALASVAQPFTFSLVAERTGAFTAFNSPIGCGDITGSGNVQVGFSNSANTALLYAGNVVTVGSVADSTAHSIQYVLNGASGSVNADGTTTGSQNAGTTACNLASASQHIAFMNSGNGNSGTVEAGEGALYPSALSAGNQAALCHNQRSYWGTAGSC